jgi:two-component system response regulator HydG
MTSTEATGVIHVLVVDDEESVRTTLAANLELNGFDVTEAASVEEAVAHLRKRRVDFVISDVRMPGRDGVSGLADLRAIQPDLPAVMITGYDAEGIVTQAMEKGAYTVLRKPVSIDKVVDVVRRGIGRPAVLVIDDEVQFLDTLVENLREAGLIVTTARTGADALAALAASKVDVCVVDLVLGKEDGADVSARIRAADPEVSVIAMTGQDVGELVKAVMQAGASHCLRKPFEVQLLTRLIARTRSNGPPPRGGA